MIAGLYVQTLFQNCQTVFQSDRILLPPSKAVNCCCFLSLLVVGIVSVQDFSHFNKYVVAFLVLLCNTLMYSDVECHLMHFCLYGKVYVQILACFKNSFACYLFLRSVIHIGYTYLFVYIKKKIC